MKKVFTLITGAWYNVSYQPSKKHGYRGPAQFISANGHGDLAFVLPEDLHTLKGDEEFVNYSYFAAKDVMSEYKGEAPMDYFELLEEVKRLKEELESKLEANRDL